MLCSKASVDGAAVSFKLRAVSQPLIMFTYSTIYIMACMALRMRLNKCAYFTSIK